MIPVSTIKKIGYYIWYCDLFIVKDLSDVILVILMDFPHNAEIGQFINGVVTKINFLLLYFEVNERFRIYIDINKSTPEFPFLYDEVEIRNPKMFNSSTNTAVIGSETCYSYLSINIPKDLRIIQFFNHLKQCKFDENEFFMLDAISRKLDKSIPENILPEVLKLLIEEAPFKVIQMIGPLRGYKIQTLEKVRVKLVTDLDYVNSNSEDYDFLNLDSCYYGVYPNDSVEKITDSDVDILVGLLDIDPTYGWFILRSVDCQLPIKFFSTCAPKNYIQKYILIKKWMVIVEMFKDKNIPPLKYIVANLSDVISIDCLNPINPEKKFYYHNESCPHRRNDRLIKILKKSEVVYGCNNMREYWIEILYLEDGLTCIFILSEKFFTLIPCLQEGFTYKMSYNTDGEVLKITSYKEVYAYRDIQFIFRLDEDTLFQDTLCNSQDLQIYEDFNDVQEVMRSGKTKIISLKAWISKKTIKLCDYPSFVLKRHTNLSYFGAPGVNHQIQLKLYDPKRESHINLYFTNRDNFIFPLGLINDMKVLIKNVQIYNNKYLKTTLFSSFEIIEYSPKVLFSSVSLSFSERRRWQWRDKSPQTLLGLYEYLPQNCVVHGTLMLMMILNLNISSYCQNCSSMKQCFHPYDSMNGWTLDIKIKFLARDAINSSFKVYTEHESFLFALLGLNQEEKASLQESFLKIGTLKLDFFHTPVYTYNCETKEIADFLEDFVAHIRESINFQHYPLIDAVCVRQNEKYQMPFKMIEFSLVS